MSGAALARVAKGRFRVDGDLDFAGVVALVKLPERVLADSDELEIDLAGVAHANSAGVALLLEWLGQVRRRGGRLHFINVPDALLRLARLSNLECLIEGNPEGCR